MRVPYYFISLREKGKENQQKAALLPPSIISYDASQRGRNPA